LGSNHSEQPYIKLDYKYRDEPRNCKVSLVFMPSNLGKAQHGKTSPQALGAILTTTLQSQDFTIGLQ
tara:strand:- start:54 stop:254 length:201 start_codon:yes stop_codon:yes gene_type:complete